MRIKPITQISVKANTYIYLVLLLLLLPLPWLTAWLTAIVFHEFSHWAAVRCCGGDVYRLTVGIGGANMECSNLSEGRRLIAILSGPVFGFAPVLLGRWIPRTAVCSWVLSVYNLLPMLPLDGGRALRILLNRRICCVIENVFLVLLTISAVYIAFSLRLGIVPLAVVVGLWLKNRKKPCKEDSCTIQ